MTQPVVLVVEELLESILGHWSIRLSARTVDINWLATIIGQSDRLAPRTELLILTWIQVSLLNWWLLMVVLNALGFQVARNRYLVQIV